MSEQMLPKARLRADRDLTIAQTVNQYAGAGAGLVPLAAARQDLAAVFAATDVDRFQGRGWLIEEIDQFLAANPCGYVWVEDGACAARRPGAGRVHRACAAP